MAGPPRAQRGLRRRVPSPRNGDGVPWSQAGTGSAACLEWKPNRLQRSRYQRAPEAIPSHIRVPPPTASPARLTRTRAGPTPARPPPRAARRRPAPHRKPDPSRPAPERGPRPGPAREPAAASLLVGERRRREPARVRRCESRCVQRESPPAAAEGSLFGKGRRR